MNETQGSARPRVLVVDDEIGNRELIRDALEAGNYDVVTASGGREALRQIRAGGIDTVVLDVVMPDVDGLEVCRQIRQNAETAALPVILVTAHYGRDERLKGIDAGASDFLRKPLDLTDLILRVRNALETKRLHDQVRADYERVVALEDLRDNLVHMIVHDLRAPLTSMRANLQLVEVDAEGVLPDESLDMIREAIESTTLFTDMVTGILDVSRLEAGEMPLNLSGCSFDSVVQGALQLLGERGKAIAVASSIGEGLEVTCDPDLMRRVVLNILSNAVEFSPPTESIDVSLSVEGPMLRFTCSDKGPGIGKADQERIFEKFGQVSGSSRSRSSSGLGLTFCTLAVAAHQGQIGVDSMVGLGSTFWFEIPTSGPASGRDWKADPEPLESVEAGPVPAV